MNPLYARLRFFLAGLFLIMLFTTVGYGDIHPITQTGKMLAVLLILMGTGTFLGVVANTMNWSDQQFFKATKKLRECAFEVKLERIDLAERQGFLAGQRRTRVNMLETPILLEHKNFSKHLSGNINRAYGSLVGQWLGCMLYLKQHYPYLYSLSVRTNPFNPKASATFYE